ncbi:goose-type lysozyme 2 [Elysia marginata]|uniref:Goose-type lysozyme 2 n=1 Tax=Elysia marginata TaxID=1093978 RepID=A0AAV4EPR0_9GAST|nr:goose-type lysozyme 2 [Elysia marginata]
MVSQFLALAAAYACILSFPVAGFYLFSFDDLNRYDAIIEAVTRTCHGNVSRLNPTGKKIGGIQASVIAAVASRESRGGKLLYKTNGLGDNGRAWGIMQCDMHTSGMSCKDCEWDSCCHIRMMVSQKLVPEIYAVSTVHTHPWSGNSSNSG